jgi:hypothetical protein
MELQKGSKVFVKEQAGDKTRGRAATVKEVVGRGAYVVFPNNITRMVMWSGLGLKENGPWGRKVFEAGNNGRPEKKKTRKKKLTLTEPVDTHVPETKLYNLSPMQKMAASVTGQVLELDKHDGTYVMISPQLANKWLAISKGANIRSVSTSTVDEYQREIEAGAWSPRSGNPILFNKKGELVNGQHRCWAIVLADKAVEMYTIFGVTAEETIRGVDNGKRRTVANAYQVPRFHVAIVNSILKYSTGFRIQRTLSTGEMGPFLEHYKSYLQWYFDIPSTSHGRKIINVSDIPGVLIRAYENGEDERLLITFLQLLRRDPLTCRELLPVGDNRIELVNRFAQFLLSMPKAGGEGSKIERVTKLEWALKKFLQNSSVKRIQANQEPLWPCPLVRSFR